MIPHSTDQSIAGLFTQLRDDTRELVRAEIDLRKVEVTARASAATTGIALVAGGAILAIAAVGGLVVGLILIAALWIGIIWATVLVTVLVLALAGLLAKLGIDGVSTALAGPEGQS